LQRFTRMLFREKEGGETEDVAEHEPTLVQTPQRRPLG